MHEPRSSWFDRLVEIVAVAFAGLVLAFAIVWMVTDAMLADGGPPPMPPIARAAR